MRKQYKIFLLFVTLLFLAISLNAAETELWGSKTSTRYHLPDCKWAKKIIPDKRLVFRSCEEAIKAGYKPCPVCQPPLTSHAEKDEKEKSIPVKQKTGTAGEDTGKRTFIPPSIEKKEKVDFSQKDVEEVKQKNAVDQSKNQSIFEQKKNQEIKKQQETANSNKVWPVQKLNSASPMPTQTNVSQITPLNQKQFDKSLQVQPVKQILPVPWQTNLSQATTLNQNQSDKAQQLQPFNTAISPAVQTAAPQKVGPNDKIKSDAKQIQPSGPVSFPATQTAMPQLLEINAPDAIRFPGNQSPAAPENKLSFDSVPATSVKSTNPALPPPPDAATNKALISGKGNVSLNFDDADIYSVIQTVFSEILKVNYIIDPKVKGRVTFRSVAPVPKDNVLPVMEVILRLNGVAVIEENSLYRIIPISDLAREPSAINIGRSAEKVEIKGKALLQVVPINYLQSSEIIKLITPFTSTNAVVVDVPKTNHIVIVDTDANVKRLLLLIDIFDSEEHKNKGPQVFVHHVQNGKAKDICALLQQIFLGSTTSAQTTAGSASKSMSAPSSSSSSSAPTSRSNVQGTINQGKTENLVSDLVKIYADEILNAIIILGTPEDYEVIKGTIAKLDIVPRQVLIEGEIASIQLTDKMSLGLAWSLKTNFFKMDPVTIALNPLQLNSDTSKTSGLSLIGIDSGNSVRAAINALASKSKAKLLASPHIMVSDNHEARIQVGQQVPIPTSQFYNTTGVASTQTTIQYKDIGIILKVKPQINDSGLVALEISQEVSTYSKELLSGQDQIILNKTEATTSLVVQDGQTIVIGGLIREDDSKSRQGIPFIYKIPLLGYLFGNTSNDVSRSELVIMLTPHVIKNQQDANSITNQFTDKMTDEEMSREIKKGIQIKEAVKQKKEVSK